MTGSKVKNAAAVVLKIKAESLPLFTRADYDVWVLRHMLRPIKPEELNDEYIEVIDITERLDSLEWVKDDLPATLDGSAGSPLHADIPPTPATSNPPTALPNDQLWRITPETHIYSFAERYRMVVVVDVTPSMAVVDDTMGKAKALISSAFETLCKTLDGVCRPFLMGSSLKGEPLHVRPDVYITVLAESGTTYFRGDQSPLAQKFAHTFPTRVLIQEVLVTRDNLALIAERLYDALNAYENDLVQQRQRDTPRERPPSEESLIVGNDSEGNLAFNASSATQVEALAELAGYGGTASKIALDSIPTDSIFRSIERALFALNVLPDNCLSCLVYITDGVISTAGSGEQIARDCCRKIARENAVFTLIQVGVGHGYIPGTNLGHVADNEFLRFLAVAAAGKFLYAADCNYLDSTVGAPVETFAPNFYHRHMLIRQNTFTKAGPESRYRAVNGSSYERLVDCPRGRLLNASVDTTQNISQEELSFPWEPTSKPPLVAEILCGYRDYTLNVVLENVVLARLNEGFILLSVHQTRRRSRDRPDKIEVILIMPWFTNVTILYTIKSVWVDQSKPMLLDRAHHKAPRIELNILAQHAFAILFINVQNLEQKSSYSASIEDKLVKLHGFLKGVYEADDALKVLASFNTKYALSVIPQTEQRLFGATTDDYVNNMTSFGSRGQLQSKAVVQNSKQANNYWHVLGQIIASKWASFNEWTVDVILRTTSGGIESARGNKRQVATIYLNEFLTSEWCTFAMEKTRLLKFVFQESSPIASGEVSGASKATRIPTGFALLSSSWDNECLVSLRLNFFSMSVTERLDMVSELTREILNIRHIIRTTGVEFRPLIVCKKPISELLVRYVPQTSDLGSMREMSDDRDIASLSNPKITTTPPDSEPTSPATSPIPPNPADTTQNHFQLSNPSLRAYLRNNRWVWLSDIAIREAELEGYSDRVPVHELAFLLMYRQRLDEGYVPVSESNGLLTLYREVQIPRRKLDTRQFGPNQFSHSTCSLQFVLLKDDIHKTVCSELWVEPIVDGPAGSALALDHKTENYPIGTLFKEHYDRVAEHILDFDRKLLNKLFTFDEIHAIGRAGGGRPGDGKYGTRGKNWSVSKGVTAVTTRFHLESVLEDGYFVTIANHAPVVFGDDLDGGDWGQQGAGGRTQMGLSPGNHLTSATPTMLTGLDANEGATDTPPSMLGRSLNPSRGNGIAGGNTPVPLSRATSHRVLGSHGAAGPGLTVSIPPSKSNLFEGLVNPSPGYRLSFEAVFLATTRRSRVALTLCRFLERVVGLLTDGEITLSDQSLTVTNPIGPIESGPLDFLEKIEAALKQHRDSLISDENQPSVDLLIRRICDSKCFVKIRDRHSFLLIFCPQYPLDTDQRSLDKTEKSDELDNDALPYLTTTIVECTRPGLAPAGTPLTNTPPFEPKSESQNEDATIQFGEWALLVRSGKELTDGCILAEGPGQRLKTRSSAFTSKATASVPPAESAKSLPSSKISDFTRQFLQKLDDGYKSAFLKTVYAALLQGYDLRKEDLDAAISACTETSIDIDITGYLNVRILSDRLRLKAEAGSEVPEREWDDEAVQKHFHEALAEHFWPVPCSGEEPPNNIYYYHPFTHKEESASDNPPSFTPQTSSTLSLSLPTGGILAASQSSSNLLAKPIPVVGPMRRNLTPEAYSAQTPGGHFSHSTSASSSQFEILFRQLECADTPLFIRTECSFRKRTMMDAEHSHIPVKNLPKSYRINSEDKAPLAEHLSTMDFTPDFVGTYASPVESRDGTRAILHLVCMTIPPLSSSEDARMNIHNVRPAKIDQSGSSQSPTHDSAPDNESYEMQEQGLAEDRLLSSLDADKQDALENVSKKIEDLLDDEIMHSLLDLERVQGPSLRLIEGILRKRHGLQTQINEGAASPTFSAAESGPSLAINFPLVFVSPEAGIDMFQTEFENINLGIGRVKRFGDLFCVIPDDKNVQDTREVEVDKAQLSRSVSEFGVQGLGISMDGLPEEFAGRTTDNHDAAKSVEDNQEPQPRSRPKFWLIITVAGFSAQVYFFSKVVTPYQRLMIIRQVRKGVSTCCERVNRFYLLGCLNETHTASKYLIAPASSVDDWSSQSLPTTKDEDALSTSSCLSEHDHTGRFPYGRFACPVVFKRSFPLHWRLRPQQALNNIVTALEAFGISNRKNMFVFAAKGSVFYMRVSVLEIEAVERGNEPGKGKEREQESKFEMNTTSPAELASPNMGRPDSPKAPHSPTMRRSTVSSFPPVSVVSGGTSNGPTNPRSAEFALVLDVYGIDKPGPQITSEFVNMIDVKINSLTQHVLGTFLARNVTIKLTPADLDFILPAAKGVEPARLEVLNLPPIIRSPYVFMLLMRQSLLNWLHVLGGADVVSALRNHYEQSYGWADRDADTPLGSKTYEVQLSDFSFLYNCIPTRNPTSSEAAIGPGIACICLALLDNSGKIILEVPAVGAEGDSENPVNLKEIAEALNDLERQPLDNAPGHPEYKLMIEIWYQGSINLDNLVTLLKQAFRNTLADYVVESAVGTLTAICAHISSAKRAQ
ncbi:hypothetical protein DFS34DRAFT_325544 [Phlyctochytrium arcticum]|nr:hypothetical protein DFS34DRAFT_325544 [Phlyctochytrium arcticum]